MAHPSVGWVSFVLAFWIWQSPQFYELALRSEGWHHLERACFIATAMIFWRPVILAWPAQSPWPRWAMILYLLLAAAWLVMEALTAADRSTPPTPLVERPVASSFQ